MIDLCPSMALAQTTTPPSPTMTAERRALHLEVRYNYEDRNSVAGFVD